LHDNLDCHGAARLAMTRQWGHCDLGPAPCRGHPALSVPQLITAPPPCHREERSDPSAVARQAGFNGNHGFQC
jgi:hypothetical protein